MPNLPIQFAGRLNLTQHKQLLGGWEI